jgi:5,10-methylenetetrahydrofolate reductase
MGLTDKAAILPSVIVPRSAGMLKYMNANVPGIEVPDEMIQRMKDAEDPKAEGIKITLELIDAIKNLSGIKGIHLQAIEAEGLLPDVIKAAGLLPRPHVY